MVKRNNQKKKTSRKEKSTLHPRNAHRGRYDFKKLIESHSDLASHVALNKYGDESINFADPAAVKALNDALLKCFYDIEFWEIPANYLCPPVPGRADYLHRAADLLAAVNGGEVPTGKRVKCLDIGVGANCVYPIIGTKEYGWSFVGSDIDPASIAAANEIIDRNARLKGVVECRLQTAPVNIFRGVINDDEKFDLSVCNPPFHASPAEARAGTIRKLSNLTNANVTRATRNFGGQNREIWCEGGEEKFVGKMIAESAQFRFSCLWFSTLISKQSNLKGVYAALERVRAFDVKTLPLEQGNKISRVVAWTFFDEKQQESWKDSRWNS